jgi:hypothetical protein
MGRAACGWRRHLCYRARGAEGQPVPDDRDNRVRIKACIGPGELDASLHEELARLQPYFGCPAEELFGQGATLWIASLDHKPACFIWAQPGDSPGEFPLPHAHTDVVLGRAVTLPSVRGGGVAAQAVKMITARLRESGATGVLASCLDWNWFSRKALERAGFEFFGSAYQRRQKRETRSEKREPKFEKRAQGPPST